jgi:uncharacterized protein (UPF0332 family)
MAGIGWCKRQKKGIRLTEPNENLCREYLESAEETLGVLRDIESKSNMWLAATRYYCEYFAVYALLMRLGIKSEIHDCTIGLCRFLEKEGLAPRNTHKRLERDKKLRIDNQYYLKNIAVKIDFPELADFVLGMKNTANSLTFDRIGEIRSKIKRM